MTRAYKVILFSFAALIAAAHATEDADRALLTDQEAAVANDGAQAAGGEEEEAAAGRDSFDKARSWRPHPPGQKRDLRKYCAKYEIGAEADRGAPRDDIRRPYAPRSSCLDIAREVFQNMDSLRRQAIIGRLDRKCRVLLSDDCLLKRLEIDEVMKRAGQITKCKDLRFNIIPEQPFRPAFYGSVYCSSSEDEGLRLKLFTLSLKEVMSIVYAGHPPPELFSPSPAPRPFPKDDRFKDVRPTATDAGVESSDGQDAGAAN